MITKAEISNDRLTIWTDTVGSFPKDTFIGYGWQIVSKANETVTIEKGYERQVYNENGNLIEKYERVQHFFNDSDHPEWKAKESTTDDHPSAGVIIGFLIAFVVFGTIFGTPNVPSSSKLDDSLIEETTQLQDKMGAKLQSTYPALSAEITNDLATSILIACENTLHSQDIATCLAELPKLRRHNKALDDFMYYHVDAP